MKNIFLIIVLVLLIIISSCDTSSDYYDDLNNKPQISVKGPFDTDFGRKHIDSLKITSGDYVLFYNISDEETLNLTLTYDPVFTVQYDHEKIIVSADEICAGNLYLSTKDTFGAVDEMTIQIVFYGNLPPVAILDIYDVPGFPFEKRIDASRSYDQDAKYGGEIVLYRFLINGKEIQKMYHPYMYYTFPRSGQYDVRLEVMDNEGAWSRAVFYILYFN